MSEDPPLDAIVFDPGEPWLAARTMRSLARRGVRADVATAETLADRVAVAAGPVWLVRAGAWSLAAPSPVLLGAAGRSVVALGATADSALWREMLVDTGGDLDRGASSSRSRSRRAWPRIDSAVALDPPSFAALVAETGSVEEAAAAAASSSRARVVRVPSLDVGFQRSLRIVLAVTTLHRGGAERIVLDLAHSLRADGHDVLVAVVDRASRATFDEPRGGGTLHLHAFARSRHERIALLGSTAAERGADVIHVHLLDGDEVERLAAGDVPVAVTVHNARPGWPLRLEEACGLRPGAEAGTNARPALVIGCSRDVSRELQEAGCSAPIRTVWNGIGARPASAPARDSSERERERTRAELGRGAQRSGPILLAVANHRPQKRLERLPAVLAAVRARGIDAELVVVGEPVRSDAASLAVAGQVRDEAARAGVSEHVILAGSRSLPDVGALYRACDVVLSLSAFEGLSLVHLEALASGAPLVTTRVSGVDELVAKHGGERVRTVEVDASPAEIGAVVAEVLASGGGGSGVSRTSALAPDFTTRAMATRHAELFSRIAAERPRPPAASFAKREGLVLVTNNFSTGGAQTSARRLLLALAEAGVPVSAVVIEEQAEYPTSGRAALVAAGVPVFAASRAGAVDPRITAQEVVAHVDARRPRAVLFWNAIPEHKILIADLLLGVPIWDVSPGEMYFASFERYFKRPRAGSPYLAPRDYGRLLEGAIVKYGSEEARAASVLGARIEVVPNGVVVSPSPRPRPRAPGSPRVVGTLARLSPDKKLEQLIDAVAHAERSGAWPRDLSLAIAGAPERGGLAYADALRERAAGLPITWAGERDSAEFLAEIDLFAMVSEPSGCPNASLEAMAAGLAIVSTDAGGAGEQIVDGETGRLVPRGDSVRLGEAIVELAADEAALDRMGRAAHARALTRFDVRRMAADYARICLGS